MDPDNSIGDFRRLINESSARFVAKIATENYGATRHRSALKVILGFRARRHFSLRGSPYNGRDSPVSALAPPCLSHAVGDGVEAVTGRLEGIGSGVAVRGKESPV